MALVGLCDESAAMSEVNANPAGGYVAKCVAGWGAGDYVSEGGGEVSVLPDGFEAAVAFEGFAAGFVIVGGCFCIGAVLRAVLKSVRRF